MTKSGHHGRFYGINGYNGPSNCLILLKIGLPNILDSYKSKTNCYFQSLPGKNKNVNLTFKINIVIRKTREMEIGDQEKTRELPKLTYYNYGRVLDKKKYI